jgi:hypothetical protein
MSDIKKSKTKYYVLAGLIVIIIAAILIIPRWNTYQHNRRAAAALEALESLKSYTENYVKTNQSASGFNVEAALVEIDISDKILKNWNFAIAWKPSVIYTQQMMTELKDVEMSTYVNVAPFKIIMAVATKESPVGEGRKVWFDGDENAYHGFGIDDEIEPDWHRIFPNP